MSIINGLTIGRLELPCEVLTIYEKLLRLPNLAVVKSHQKQSFLIGIPSSLIDQNVYAKHHCANANNSPARSPT